MNINIKCVLKTVLLSHLLISKVFAGNEGGGGGDAVVCSNYVEFYDLYEGRELDSAIKYDFGPNESYIKKIKYMLNKLKVVDAGRARIMEQLARDFESNTQFANGQLTDIPDTGIGSYPYGCSLAQLGIQRFGNELRKNRKQFLVDKVLWNRMDENNKAMFVTHEILLTEFKNNRGRNEVSTALLREFNQFLWSTNFNKLTRMQYVKILGSKKMIYFSDQNSVNCKYDMLDDNTNVFADEYKLKYCYIDEPNLNNQTYSDVIADLPIKMNVTETVHYKYNDSDQSIDLNFKTPLNAQEIGFNIIGFKSAKTDLNINHINNVNVNINYDFSNIKFSDKNYIMTKLMMHKTFSLYRFESSNSTQKIKFQIKDNYDQNILARGECVKIDYNENKLYCQNGIIEFYNIYSRTELYKLESFELKLDNIRHNNTPLGMDPMKKLYKAFKVSGTETDTNEKYNLTEGQNFEIAAYPGKKNKYSSLKILMNDNTKDLKMKFAEWKIQSDSQTCRNLTAKYKENENDKTSNTFMAVQCKVNLNSIKKLYFAPTGRIVHDNLRD